MQKNDGRKIMLIVGVLGLLATLMAVEEGDMPSLGQASGSLPDLPGLREREALEPGFMATLLWVIQSTGADGDKLAALMSEESRFNPQARNSIGATGLLQWVPKYAKVSGYSTDELFAMTGLEQLVAVRNTIVNDPGYKTDPAMAGWGSHVDAPDATVIATTPSVFYTGNADYDKTNKGYITVGDVRAAVYGPLAGAGRIEVS